jgi:hypothetical protein
VWTERPPLPPPPPVARYALPPPPPPALAPLTGIPACDELLAGMDRLSRCDGYPAEGRAAIRQAVDQMRDAWAGMASYPPEARTAAGDACKQALDGLHQGAASIHCEL